MTRRRPRWTIPNNRLGVWGIGFGFAASLVLAACSDAAVSVDNKLSHITEQSPTPVQTPPAMPVPVLLSYQADKDPFANPYRTGATVDNQNGDTASDNLGKKTDKNTDKSTHDGDNKSTGDNANNTDKSSNQPNADQKSNATPSTAQQPDAPSMPAVHGKLMQIDTARRRQPLEQYELASLRYQGSIADDNRFVALVISPDGLVHRVAIGQYMGKNHGQITHIDARNIRLTEAVMAADGRYYQHETTLHFIDKSLK
ncbi:pilus assembly protein PilP [Moraxella marmotae]|uniref:pilus assembly protein PilP n=1 Tax=Moraxella marmotae TaxID=3344520 RepID=UPI0035F29D9B